LRECLGGAQQGIGALPTNKAALDELVDEPHEDGGIGDG